MFEQRFFQKLGHTIHGNIGNNGVLSRGEANLSVAMDIGQAREFLEMIGGDPAGWNAEPYGRKPRTFL